MPAVQANALQATVAQSLLQLVCANQICDALLVLVDCGVDLEVKDKDGRTPLARAAAAGLHDVVGVLAYELHADFEAADEGGRRPLALAAAHGNDQCVRVLLEMGADARASDATGTTALMHASATDNNNKVIGALLMAAQNVNAQNDQGQTALMWAASRGQAAAVKLLLDHGADISLRDFTSSTAVGLTASSGP